MVDPWNVTPRPKLKSFPKVLDGGMQEDWRSTYHSLKFIWRQRFTGRTMGDCASIRGGHRFGSVVSLIAYFRR